MNTVSHAQRVSAASLLLVTALTSAAHAETVECTPVTSLPAIISVQGLYCLTANLATAQSSGNAIEITANNVTLDLNGWKVGGQAAGSATGAIGIYSTANNVAIQNGIVRGFSVGIYLLGRGAMVQDIVADQNTATGISVGGTGSVVQGNQVVDTGGSTTSANVYGIYVLGPGSLIQNNLVSGLATASNGREWGINFDSTADQSTGRGNVISDAARPSAGSFGIHMFSTSAVAVTDNIVTNFSTCVAYVAGATGTYSRNTAISCDTPYSGGTAGSGND